VSLLDDIRLKLDNLLLPLKIILQIVLQRMYTLRLSIAQLIQKKPRNTP
jgi:hypothetical protein